MASMSAQDRDRALHAWADGVWAHHAAVLVLTRTLGGRMADEEWPWIVVAPSWCRSAVALDVTAFAEAPAYLSSVERLVVDLAASLCGRGVVDLGQLAHLGPQDGPVVVEAIACATLGTGVDPTHTYSH